MLNKLTLLLLFTFISSLSRASSSDTLQVKENTSQLKEVIQRLDAESLQDSIHLIQLNDKKYTIIEGDTSFQVFRFEMYEILSVVIIGIALIGTFIYLLLFWKKQQQQHQSKIELLSERELLVAQLIQSGKMNKEIADELNISISTVKTHINNLYKKLELTDRTQLKKLDLDILRGV
ncbi:helix-turn-helix transcriptional regulator [Flammeovirga sp. SJP92]|uniref:helix-turn-helix domain-containing protein n=1 Tax=Flammeovirga sp. SJP92 TaxID=1775430 RepID=UPI0007876886|nr:helix-turn-helix transcriptional regulator [Flammeovirga sp. SJP92]KXX67921.1 hypothetical protein AVL50_23985 [Flammeovirga sp. SJP92]